MKGVFFTYSLGPRAWWPRSAGESVLARRWRLWGGGPPTSSKSSFRRSDDQRAVCQRRQEAWLAAVIDTIHAQAAASGRTVL